MMAGSIDVDLDNSYVDGGYDISASLPDGVTILHSDFVPHYDASELRWFRIENGASGPVLVAYDTASGAPGAQTTAADDMTGHTGLVVGWIGH
jgi:hypothetical protein